MPCLSHLYTVSTYTHSHNTCTCIYMYFCVFLAAGKQCKCISFSELRFKPTTLCHFRQWSISPVVLYIHVHSSLCVYTNMGEHISLSIPEETVARGFLPLSILLYTVFTRILAAATINLSRARVRLLIEGGSYSRAALIKNNAHARLTYARADQNFMLAPI